MKKLLPLIILFLLIISAIFLLIKDKYTDTEGNFILFEKGLNVYQLKSGEVPAVTEYLQKNLNDIKSYEPVEWGDLTKYRYDNDGNPIYIVRHDFRAANGFGGVTLSAVYFEIDHLGLVTKTMTPEQYTDNNINMRLEEMR